MNADPKIAVIIVNWKKYDFTLKCIESVINSSFKNFKIILIDPTCFFDTHYQSK